jgi:hypothetical protein
VVEPLVGIVGAPNALVMVAGAATVRLADAVFPVPPLVDVTFPVVLEKFPDVVPTTLTVNAQDPPFAATVPPLRLMLAEPALAVAVPPQVFPRPLGVATTKPDGSVSVSARPVRAPVLAAGLVMASTSADVPFTAIAVGLNDFAIVGGATTEIEAEAVPPVPPSVEVTLLVVLFFVPAEVPVTFTENVHELVAPILAPDRLTAPPPDVALTAPPPHVPVNPFGVETVKPDGSVSLKPTFDNAVVVSLF